MVLDTTFAHPRGLLGRLGGMVMARATRLRNAWTLSLLDVQPDDRLLEVGCGPGALLQALSAHTAAGLIVGIDLSPVMLQQASRRNAEAIRQGRVQVQAGTALSLPFAEASFEKVLSANSVPFWPDKKAGVQEMWRVLIPGGTIALILQPRWAKTEQEVKENGDELAELLAQAGFQRIRLELKSMKPIASVCALGTKEKTIS